MNKLLKILIVFALIAVLFGFGMNAFASLHTKWSAGDLVFYDGATDIFAIRSGTGGIKVFDDIKLTFGTDNDATIEYDEDGTDKLILTSSGGFTITGVVNFATNTDASSLTVASVVFSGGVAITKQLYIGDDIDMSVSGTGTYDLTLKDAVADALSIVRGATDMIVFDTATPKITITPATTITDTLTLNNGIIISGTYDHGIRFTEDPVAGDVTNSFINIGDYTTGIAVAPTTANMFGVMHNVTLTDVNVAYWYQAYYTKITTSGTTTSTSIAGHALRMMVGSDLAAVYGIQSHVVVSGARTFTSEVTAGSFYLDVGSTTISNAGSRVNALQAVLVGSSTVTSASFAIASFTAATNVSADTLVFIGQDSTVTSDTVIEFDLDGTVTNVWEFNGTVSDAWAITDSGVAAISAENEWFLIPVTVEGSAVQFYIIAAETWN